MPLVRSIFKPTFARILISMTRLLFILSTLIVLTSSCNEYNKVLKGEDVAQKYNLGLELYEDEKYYKAYPLLEEAYTFYRGSARAEDLYFKMAYSDYYLGDWLLAAHRFSQFTENFPASPNKEEAAFMSAYCNYLLSPDYSLDQGPTGTAIASLQTFIDRYPSSNRIDTCTVLIDELEYKLELKAYDAANLYLKTQHYKAAIQAYENLLLEFPDTEFREEIYFSSFEAAHHLAMGSVVSKQLERIDAALKAYDAFVVRYPESEYTNAANRYFRELNDRKSKLTNSNN